MTRRSQALVVALVAAFSAAALPTSAHALTSCEPAAQVPEVPGGPLLLLGAALAATAGVLFLRRHRGITPAVLSTLALVVLAGAVIGAVSVGAATDPCNPNSPGQVLGSATSTPLTGADIPWIAAVVLVAVGIALTAVALSRRRRSHPSAGETEAG